MRIIKHLKQPLSDYFELLPKWDGKDYINELAKFITVTAPEKDRFGNNLKKLFIRMTATALDVDYSNNYAFTFVHKGKHDKINSLIKWLSPLYLSKVFLEKPALKPSECLLLTNNFIINYGNIDALTIAKIENFFIHLRAGLISYESDEIKETIFKKSANFFCHTEKLEFLSYYEETCNWICFYIHEIDESYKKAIDINDIWSQALALYKMNENFFPDLEQVEHFNQNLLLELQSVNKKSIWN